MWIFFAGLAALLLGFLLYSKVPEKIIKPFRSPTPAYSENDGVDYVPMPTWKNHMIELLNIAGTGPIFGALMGAKWGPVAFLWVIFGSILGGAVHDYMSGMMSVRNGGKTLTRLTPKYLGPRSRYIVLIFVVAVLIFTAAMMARSACDLLVHLTGIDMIIWLLLISVYFVVSAVLPIDKVIGRLYPIFGILLIVMAIVVIVGLATGGYEFPTMTLQNLHPQGEEIFPDMFITIACGAVSGFHATQSTLVARCLKDEKDGRVVFYGAMIVEAFIAFIWLTAGLTFYPDTLSLSDALDGSGASGVVYDISTTLAGPVGGVLAVVGVIICPITSGDTAIRSARMMVQDDIGLDTRNTKAAALITACGITLVILLCLIPFQSLWYYMSWFNQTLACLTLWTCTVFILKTAEKRIYSLVTALPAIFMTMVTTTFILHWERGLGLDYGVSLAIGALITVFLSMIYVNVFIVTKKDNDDPSVP